MKIRLSLRKHKVRLLPFTGRTFCGCRFLNGDLLEPCGSHVLHGP